jgi:hypothetical protein
MAGAHRIVHFRGGVSCRRDEGLLGLTLIGRTSDQPDELVSLALPAAAPVGLPDVLEDAAVERVDANTVRISSGEREWTVGARTWHLHHEVSSLFYSAIPPRAAPWNKRVFWRLILALVGHPVGKRLLLAFRRR